MIVDTSVVIDAVERRSARAAAVVAALDEPSVRSMVVVGELTFGVESLTPEADAALRARRQAEALCRQVPVLTADSTLHLLGTTVDTRLGTPVGAALTLLLQPPDG